MFFGTFQLNGTVQAGGVFVFPPLGNNIFTPGILSQTWAAQGVFTVDGLGAVITIDTSMNPDGTFNVPQGGPAAIPCTINATWAGTKTAGPPNVL